MFDKNSARILTAFAVAALGGLALSATVVRPAPGDPGAPFCFGDGTSSKCMSESFGVRGHGCDNSVHMGGAYLSATGVARVARDSMQFTATGLPRSTLVLLVQGDQPMNFGVGRSFGDGIECITGRVIRIDAANAVNGTWWYPQRSHPDLSTAGMIPPDGGARHYQLWYRDTADFGTRATWNMSNGWTTVWAP